VRGREEPARSRRTRVGGGRSEGRIAIVFARREEPKLVRSLRAPGSSVPRPFRERDRPRRSVPVNGRLEALLLIPVGSSMPGVPAGGGVDVRAGRFLCAFGGEEVKGRLFEGGGRAFLKTHLVFDRDLSGHERKACLERVSWNARWHGG
jgi:hypothetical protein